MSLFVIFTIAYIINITTSEHGIMSTQKKAIVFKFRIKNFIFDVWNFLKIDYVRCAQVSHTHLLNIAIQKSKALASRNYELLAFFYHDLRWREPLSTSKRKFALLIRSVNLPELNPCVVPGRRVA